ncbi:thiamine biosynthesis lipoprotein [Alteromonadaceae bacterium Bs31]|nr:thiamine biosynthesis lipoprotein [Alteromonadaceae bacterium Bs31]
MSQALQLHSHRFKAMGSPCELQYYAPAETAGLIFTTTRKRLNQLEQKYSRYLPKSVTSQINSSAGSGETIEVDNETLGLLHYADTLHKQSDGLFDITSGPLRQAWNFRSGKLPSREKLDALLPLIGWQKAEWNPPHFALPLRGMEIDFGGFVKEYAADQLAQILTGQGIEHGLVNLGGDLVIIGPHPDDSPWQVGIQHPRKTNEAIVQLPLHRGAIATSGDYERFMLIEGNRYSHLLNPCSGWPVKPTYAAVTVIAEQCLIAGSFSSIAMLKSEHDQDWLSNSGLAYLSVDQKMQLSGNIIETR